MSTLALIGLGSNLGDRRAILDGAVAALAGTPGVEVRAVSSYHETAPTGGPGGQGAFLNAAAALETTRDPGPLHALLRAVEAQAGRIRTVRWGERTLDLDLLLFGDLVLDSPELQVPHPRMAVRRFVLAPLVEIAPAAIDPMTRRTVADLLANLDRRPSYLALEGPDGPLKRAVFLGVTAGLGALGLAGAEVVARRPIGTDPLVHRLDELEARASRLDLRLWPADGLRDRWLVTDFCVPLDHGRALAPLIALALKDRGVIDRRYRPAVDRWEAAVRRALLPTFAVVIAGGPQPNRTPELSEEPLLWAESTDPQVVVAEILAACAASRSGFGRPAPPIVGGAAVPL